MDIYRNMPIPPPPNGEYPIARETGEPLVDITDTAGITYGASYLQMGIAGAMSRCLLRTGAAERLQAVAAALPPGYGLLIFDAYRPLAVQQAIYNRFYGALQEQNPTWTPEQLAARMDDFVALPRRDYLRPAPHSTGGAVDLTLTLHGEPLEMGTAFDDFSPMAATRWFEDHPPVEIRENRRLLYNTMRAEGFVNYYKEWWHFSYGDRAWSRATGNPPMYSLWEETET